MKIQNNINEKQNIEKDKDLFGKNNKINVEEKAGLEVHNIDEKNIIIINTNEQKEDIKVYIINKKSTHEKIVKDIRELLRENKKIILDTSIDKIENAFTAIKVLNDEGIAILDEELKIERNFKAKTKTKILISLKKKDKIIN